MKAHQGPDPTPYFSTDLMEPTRPFASFAISSRRRLVLANMEVAPSPTLVTPLAPLGCVFPTEITNRGHTGLLDPQMPPAADCPLLRRPGGELRQEGGGSGLHGSFLLSPPQLHRRDSVPLRQDTGLQSQHLCVH